MTNAVGVADLAHNPSPEPDDSRGFRRAMAWLTPVVGVLLFGAALWVLHRELRHVDYPQLMRTVRAVPGTNLLLALLFMVINYVVLTWYDHLAFVYIKKRLDFVRVSLASFVAYALANNVGFALLSGGAVRYRFYSRWGLSAGDLSRVVFCYSVTYWLGLMALSGWSLAVSPLPGLTYLMGRTSAQALGFALLAMVALYQVSPLLRREPFRFGGFELPLPSLKLAAAQLVVSVVDWLFAGLVLLVLLPEGSVGLAELLGAFVAAQIIALISHVPGGLGVFESSMVILLKPDVDASVLLPALLLFRVVYYLVPLAVAMGVLLVDELLQRREQVQRLGTFFGEVSDELAPRLFAALTFIAGAVLLFSGATPGRTAVVAELAPLSVMELAHFSGALVGMGLLLVSHGVARRLERAYFAAITGLGAGIVISLLKGADYEEAGVIAVLLLALLESGDEFERRAGFFATRFSTGWITAVVGVLGASLWLGSFAYKHVAYDHALWWSFGYQADVSRFLRGSAGATLVLLAFTALGLNRRRPAPVTLPDDARLARAERVIASQTTTLPYLVHLRDKALLFGPGDEAFVMYAVHGRSWVALGDPVGPAHAAPAVIRAFVERSDDFGGQPVFYEARAERLPQYAEVGLTSLEVGEVARVPLASFSLDDPARASLRASLDALEQDGGRFRIVPSHEVPRLLRALRSVSDEWLAGKRGTEKGFAMGVFDEDYLWRFPVIVFERGGQIEAFANLWPGPGGVELSLDLVRFRAAAPDNVMDGMFARVMAWGREQGYAYFDLGMAPISGRGLAAVVPLWRWVGGWVYRHGEAFRDFEALRAYKDRFQPEWSPRYIAYPGSMHLHLVLADIAALIAGGSRRRP